MGNPFFIGTEEKAGWLWITLPDAVNMDNYQQIEDEIGEVLPDNAPKVVLDLQNLGYFYSSAMGLLIRVQKSIVAGGGRVCLVNVSRRIRQLLESVKLDKLFPIYATDVEFEVSEDDAWVRASASAGGRFVSAGQTENGVRHVSISGVMALGNDLKGFEDSVSAEDAEAIVLDLTGLEYVDSFGLGVLWEMLRRARDQGKRVAAYGSNSRVRELFSMVSVGDLLTVSRDERSALEQLGKV